MPKFHNDESIREGAFFKLISTSNQVRNTDTASPYNEAVQCGKIAQYLVEALKRCAVKTMTNLTESMSAR